MPTYVSLLVLKPGEFSSLIAEIAERAGIQFQQADSLEEVRRLLQKRSVEILLAVIRSESEARQIVEYLHKHEWKGQVISAFTDAGTANGLSLNAFSQTIVLSESFAGKEEMRRVLEAAGRAVELGRGHSRNQPLVRLGALIGQSGQMKRIYELIRKSAHHSYPVLILGESGTGKELVARCIHEMGPRAKGPFVPIDCSALAPSLIESELFGHVRGAFTGAMSAKEGLMASAATGTLFLDEIGNLPMDLQAKLLRAIQEKEIKPVGSNSRVQTDARIIAATNRDLEDGIREGNFRRDLFFRLNVVQIRIPRLCDRLNDIPALVEHFMQKFHSETSPTSISDEAMNRLKKYSWPGNVRELENAIERAMALSSGPVLHTEDLPSNLQHFDQAESQQNGVLSMKKWSGAPFTVPFRNRAGTRLRRRNYWGLARPRCIASSRDMKVVPARVLLIPILAIRFLFGNPCLIVRSTL